MDLLKPFIGSGNIFLASFLTFQYFKFANIQLFFLFSHEADFKFTILFLFASEGDNRQDSRLLAHHFNELTNLVNALQDEGTLSYF